MDGKKLQVQETKDMLVRALLTLLQSQDFTAISVKDIIEVSQTSRRTFYRHFRNKSDLLDYYFQQLTEEYFAMELEMLEKYDDREAFLHLFRFWYGKRQELRGIIRSKLFSPFVFAWNVHGPAVIERFFGEDQMDGNLFRIHFLIGGFSNSIWSWLQQEEPEPPEVITDYFLSIACYFIGDDKDQTGGQEGLSEEKS
ncbi:Transcriptional regulator [Streptococcus sp. DD11]|nr:Transcriptional regulator [Streptococcus sp. DD11]